MRWLKHLTQAHNDTAICAILEEFGPTGYGIYWLILEEFAAVVDRDSTRVPSLIHSELRWSQICHCSVRTFRNFAQRAAELKLIECRSAAELMQFSSRTKADRLQIDVPKLLKYRDEYSKKSGHSPDSKEDKKESRKRAEGEENTPAGAGGSPLEIVGGKNAQPNPTRETVEAAWENHKCYRNGESLDHAVRIILSQDFDWKKLADRHPKWCEHWNAVGWNSFGALTFIGWIQAGMPLPPARASPAKQLSKLEVEKELARQRHRERTEQRPHA